MCVTISGMPPAPMTQQAPGLNMTTHPVSANHPPQPQQVPMHNSQPSTQHWPTTSQQQQPPPGYPGVQQQVAQSSIPNSHTVHSVPQQQQIPGGAPTSTSRTQHVPVMTTTSGLVLHQSTAAATGDSVPVVDTTSRGGVETMSRGRLTRVKPLHGELFCNVPEHHDLVCFILIIIHLMVTTFMEIEIN